MSRSSVSQLFIAVFIGLFVQYGLVGILGVTMSEPWPAVVLPGFKKVYDTGQDIVVEDTQIDVQFGNGMTATTRPSEFLALLPRSHHGAFLSKQCRPASLSGSAETERCTTDTGSRWFVERAETLYPNREVQRVDVVWTRLTFDRGTGDARNVPATSATVTRTPLDTLRLDP
jgi:hypothetical protein